MTVVYDPTIIFRPYSARDEINNKTAIHTHLEQTIMS